jgi:hypothetical protein
VIYALLFTRVHEKNLRHFKLEVADVMLELVPISPFNPEEAFSTNSTFSQT